MSEEQLNAFLEKVKSDTSLQEKLKAAASPEAAIEIAKAAGFSITSADIQSMQSATVELSDEELEGAASTSNDKHFEPTINSMGVTAQSIPKTRRTNHANAARGDLR